MNTASEDIATLLSEQTSLGLELADPSNDVVGNLFFTRMPDQPDDCAAVLDGPGSAPMLAQKKLAKNYHYSAVTIYVRNTEYEVGWEQISSILEFLHGHSDETIGGTYYALIRALSDPQVLEYDESERPVFMVNFEVQRRST